MKQSLRWEITRPQLLLSNWKDTRLPSFTLSIFVCLLITPPSFGMLECLLTVFYCLLLYWQLGATGTLCEQLNLFKSLSLQSLPLRARVGEQKQTMSVGQLSFPAARATALLSMCRKTKQLTLLKSLSLLCSALWRGKNQTKERLPTKIASFTPRHTEWRPGDFKIILQAVCVVYLRLPIPGFPTRSHCF